MENYKVQKKLGDGTYGCVYKATHKSGEVVAIKKFKQRYQSWDECMQLREIKSLRKLTHPNIIKLKEVLKVQDELNLVFEFLERNVLEVYMEYKNRNDRMSESQIKSIVRQVLEGLAYMHKHGYFHRDLKPENLLMHGETVKICDFGLAREIRSRPPYTDYVATRWYRAPEILLKQQNYNSPVDIFALGCIMAELYMLAPLFSGSSEIDQMLKIVQVLGNPTSQWPEAQKLANQIGFSFPNHHPINLEKIIPNCSMEGLQVITDMLKYDPSKRPSAQQLLSYPYFSDSVSILPTLTPPPQQIRPLRRQEEDSSKDRFFKPPEKRTQEKFKDSSQNFLELLDQHLADHDKDWNRRGGDKKKDSQQKFLQTREKFQQQQRVYQPQYEDTDKDREQLPQFDEGVKRNNPFKLLKYNDPIMNGLNNTSIPTNNNHIFDALPPRQQKPLSMIHSNQYNQQYQPHLQGKSSMLPKIEPAQSVPMSFPNVQVRQPISSLGGPSKLPFYYQSKLHQNYGRAADNIPVGNNGRQNSKLDDFGFTKQQKQFY